MICERELGSGLWRIPLSIVPRMREQTETRNQEQGIYYNDSAQYVGNLLS